MVHDENGLVTDSQYVPQAFFELKASFWVLEHRFGAFQVEVAKVVVVELAQTLDDQMQVVLVAEVVFCVFDGRNEPVDDPCIDRAVFLLLDYLKETATTWNPLQVFMRVRRAELTSLSEYSFKFSTGLFSWK